MFVLSNYWSWISQSSSHLSSMIDFPAWCSSFMTQSFVIMKHHYAHKIRIFTLYDVLLLVNVAISLSQRLKQETYDIRLVTIKLSNDLNKKELPFYKVLRLWRNVLNFLYTIIIVILKKRYSFILYNMFFLVNHTV